MVKDNFEKWMTILSPLFGNREARNMWHWYGEANRRDDQFDNDLSRLADHYPIQYLTGYGYFYGEKFRVNEHTLIPRPETEELVFKILEDHPEDRELKVIDLGTGTGCIAITLKKHRPSWHITGLELYPDTLKVARKNGEIHQTDVDWIVGDMLHLDMAELPLYDIVISNPPYISVDEKVMMDKNVWRYEPHQALFTGDPGGLEYYKAIAKYGRSLKSGTEIYLEINENYAAQVAGLFDEAKLFIPPEIILDMQGKNRILHVKRL